MGAVIIIGSRCHYCAKYRSPRDIISMPGGVKICAECEQRHNEALAAISSGNFMGECSECGRKPEQLRSVSGHMAVHYEGGKYKAMCLDCDAVYVPKRRDLYADTEFGWNQGLN